jgi:hypothetical protein
MSLLDRRDGVEEIVFASPDGDSYLPLVAREGPVPGYPGQPISTELDQSPGTVRLKRAIPRQEIPESCELNYFAIRCDTLPRWLA